MNKAVVDAWRVPVNKATSVVASPKVELPYEVSPLVNNEVVDACKVPVNKLTSVASSPKVEAPETVSEPPVVMLVLMVLAE